MMLYEVNYENLTDGQKTTLYIRVYDFELSDSVDRILHQRTCDMEHCYHGNQETGHGEFKIDYRKVNRESNDFLLSEIEFYSREITKIQDKINKISKQLEEPFTYETL